MTGPLADPPTLVPSTLLGTALGPASSPRPGEACPALPAPSQGRWGPLLPERAGSAPLPGAPSTLETQGQGARGRSACGQWMEAGSWVPQMGGSLCQLSSLPGPQSPRLQTGGPDAITPWAGLLYPRGKGRRDPSKVRAQTGGPVPLQPWGPAFSTHPTGPCPCQLRRGTGLPLPSVHSPKPTWRKMPHGPQGGRRRLWGRALQDKVPTAALGTLDTAWGRGGAGPRHMLVVETVNTADHRPPHLMRELVLPVSHQGSLTTVQL